MPPENGTVHVECIIIRNAMASAKEAELGWLFETFQKATSMRKALAYMGHLQPPTPVATDNTAVNNIINVTAKQKRSKAIDIRFYWVRDRIQQNHFHVFWEEGKKTWQTMSQTTTRYGNIEQ